MKVVLGITGSIGSGKTFCCKRLFEIAKSRNINCIYLSIDEIKDDILGNNPNYKAQRIELSQSLGSEVLNNNYSINRNILSQFVYKNDTKMQIFKDKIFPIINSRIQNEINMASGIVLFEWALLIEDNLLPFINKVLIVKCNENTQLDRLKSGNLPMGNIKKRIHNCMPTEKKIEVLSKQNCIPYIFDTSRDPETHEYMNLFKEIFITKE